MTERTQTRIEDLKVGDRFSITHDGPVHRVVVKAGDVPTEYARITEDGHSEPTFLALTHLHPHKSVWVEQQPEAIEVPTHDGHPLMSEATARANAEAATAQYQEGVRDGYLKALQERRDEPAAGRATAPAFRREDAIMLAVQAHTADGPGVVELARAIEQYVNENEQAYPHPDGETVVLGPGVFASEDRSVLNWNGVNYVPQAEPERPQRVAPIPLTVERIESLPVGTVLIDEDGDTYTREVEGAASAWRFRASNGAYLGVRWTATNIMVHRPRILSTPDAG